MIPVCPVRHDVGICNQHSWRIFMCSHNGNRFARLNHQCFIRIKVFQSGYDTVEVLPRARRSSDPTIDHQLVRVFRHVWVQVVHQHPHWRLGQPAFCGDLGAGGRINVAEVVARVGHDVPFLESAMFSSVSRIWRRCLRSGAALVASYAKGGFSDARCVAWDNSI